VDWDPLWCWNLRIWSGPLVELHSALLLKAEGKMSVHAEVQIRTSYQVQFTFALLGTARTSIWTTPALTPA